MQCSFYIMNVPFKEGSDGFTTIWLIPVTSFGVLWEISKEDKGKTFT